MFFTQSRLRTILRLALFLIVIALAAQGGRLLHSRIKAQSVRWGAPVPYTVMLREVIHSPNGEALEGFDVTLAIRSDGSSVRRIVHKQRQVNEKIGSEPSSERTVQFASGIEVAINELANTKTSIFTNSSSEQWQRDPKSKCLNSLAGTPMSSTPEVLGGEELVNGYRTAKIIRANVTEWHALDYGCAMVKDRWDFGGKEYTEKYLLDLVSGEPSTQLFAVPETAREVTPSERLLGAKNDCSACNQRTLKALRKLDEQYKKKQAVIP